MVSIDACMGLVIWFPEVPCEVADAKERVDYLLTDLERRKEKILIPAPALAELLVHAGEAGPEFVNRILKSSRFQMGDFDTRAAIEVALAIDKARKAGNKRGKGNKENWQKIKYDHQIVAISKVENASVIYSNDSGLANFAESNGMKVISLVDLPVPPSKTPLFDGVPELASPPQVESEANTSRLLAAPQDRKTESPGGLD
jgi:hypothetical protein